MEIKTSMQIFQEYNIDVTKESYKKWVAVDDVVNILKDSKQYAMATIIKLLLELDR